MVLKRKYKEQIKLGLSLGDWWPICGTTLLEIRVLQGFFTNTYNKPYPIGYFTL
jgi:hypothetical protein